MLLFVYNIVLFLIDIIHFTWKAVLYSLQSALYVILPPSRKSLSGETVLITGAGHGIGRELALELSRKGAKLVLWDINQEGNEQTAAEVKKSGGRVHVYNCDVSSREEVTRTAELVWEEVGNITILINNAGIMPAQPFNGYNQQQIRRVIEVNVMALFWTIGEFLPRMMEMGKGHVVSISSLAGRMGIPNITPYCASKFAVAGMMESLCEELRYAQNYPDIHFTTVFPIFVDTGLAKNPRMKYPWLTPLIDPEYVSKKIIDGIQRNAEHVYVPAYYEMMYRFSNVLPRKVQKLLIDFLDAGVNPHED